MPSKIKRYLVKVVGRKVDYMVVPKGESRESINQKRKAKGIKPIPKGFHMVRAKSWQAAVNSRIGRKVSWRKKK